MRSRALLGRIDGHLGRIDGHLGRIDGHLGRIDGHLERADQRWARIEEEIGLTREEVRLSREQRERHAEMFADLRQFTREMMVRMERVTKEHVRVSQEQVGALRDLRAESAAQRQALLRMLDRLGPGDSPSAA